MRSLRKKGLEVAPGISVRASETQDGEWLAWVEREGEPMMQAPDQPRLFSGHTRYQAQCAAVKWLRADEGVSSAKPTRKSVRFSG